MNAFRRAYITKYDLNYLKTFKEKRELRLKKASKLQSKSILSNLSF